MCQPPSSRALHGFAALLILLLSIAALSGCDDGPLESELDWRGDYTVESTWDLSPMLNADRTLGTAATEIMVASIMSSLDLPGPVEDEAREKLTALISPKIKPVIDSALPSDLTNNSELLQRLNTIVTSVQVSSTLKLEDPDHILANAIGGRETLSGYVFEVGADQTFLLDPQKLIPPGATETTIDAAWGGSVKPASTTLNVESHAFKARLGDMLTELLTEVIAETGTQDLVDQALAGVDCTAIVSDLIGGEPLLSFTFAGEDYSVGEGQFQTACDAITSQSEERILGLITPDATVELGGDLELIDDDGDKIVDRIEGLDNYSGYIKFSGVAIPFDATFKATRVK